MKFICDFHIHSRFSRATSSSLIPENLDYWCRVKGIKVIGTGDFTHPGWLLELKEKLEPAEPGLFRLKESFQKKDEVIVSSTPQNEPRFLLTTELSCIYKKNNKVRKVHNLVFAPDFTAAERIQQRLSKIGNIVSDGRPILGIDCRDLLELMLECCEQIFFVPAHIWTPWFSVLGDKSGFDSIEECFEDLSCFIRAVETGLSSDPPMNWLCSFLDRFTLISNSDAHSPDKLGREANIFDTELSYDSMISALSSGEPQKCLGTIEFYPQEGKYHYDGHRMCGICWDPFETKRHDSICPVCGKKVVIGVMNRVVQLSDRQDVTARPNRLAYYNVIPLCEIIAEIERTNSISKRVINKYNSIVAKAGSEFNVLMELDIESISKIGGTKLGEAVRRMRNGEVYVKEGFDGEYGRVKVFGTDSNILSEEQQTLFPAYTIEAELKRMDMVSKVQSFKLKDEKNTENIEKNHEYKTIGNDSPKTFIEFLNEQQKAAVMHGEYPCLIVAGPGTGKTGTLAAKIAYLIQFQGVSPEDILAVTFTNKAADEMRSRIASMLKCDSIAGRVFICTFHAFGLGVLKQWYNRTGRTRHFTLIDEEEKKENIISLHSGKKIDSIIETISLIKNKLQNPEQIKEPLVLELFSKYQERLLQLNAFDYDDLLYWPAMLFKTDESIVTHYRNRIKWIFVDEYQDVNYAQYSLIRSLMPDQNSNLCVIGDPDQAIYGFRGADVEFIRRFMLDYPRACIYRLAQSYRCSDFIIRASQGVLEKVPSEHRHVVRAVNKGVKVELVSHVTDKAEAEFIARTIEQMIGGVSFFSLDSGISSSENQIDASPSDFAILCRISRQFDVIEKALNDHGIPSRKIESAPNNMLRPIRVLATCLNSINNGTHRYVVGKGLYSDIEKVVNTIRDKPIIEIVETIVNNFFYQEYKENEEFFKEVMKIAESCNDDIEDFVNRIVLGQDVDFQDFFNQKVTLMTLHAAKGLEFSCVFIAGCEDGLIPYSLFEKQKVNVEEERRLLYVGMTRAKNRLFLSHARRRRIFGKEYMLGPSPFLEDIHKELINITNSEYKPSSSSQECIQLSLF